MKGGGGGLMNVWYGMEGARKKIFDWNQHWTLPIAKVPKNGYARFQLINKLSLAVLNSLCEFCWQNFALIFVILLRFSEINLKCFSSESVNMWSAIE
jgi:hypothetical protein